MAIKIKSTKNTADNGAKIVIYGDSGVGKTKLIATAPNPIIISAEKGLLSLADFDLPYMEVHTLDDVQEAFSYCKKSDYETIYLDSVTEIAEEVLSVMKVGKKDKRQAYGELAEAMGSLIRNFRDLDGKNVIMNAKEKPVYDEDDNIIGYVPMMPGRVLPHGLPYLVDEVFSYQIDRKGNRFFQTAKDRKRPAKDRSGKLDAVEMNPDMTVIINKILGK
jgi:energy-coupling factor transporter ATP-binding protein EcfA2